MHHTRQTTHHTPHTTHRALHTTHHTPHSTHYTPLTIKHTPPPTHYHTTLHNTTLDTTTHHHTCFYICKNCPNPGWEEKTRKNLGRGIFVHEPLLFVKSTLLPSFYFNQRHKSLRYIIFSPIQLFVNIRNISIQAGQMLEKLKSSISKEGY